MGLKGEFMYKCFICNGELIWMSDFDYEDIFGEGEGIVSYYHCNNCNADIEFAQRFEEEGDC